MHHITKTYKFEGVHVLDFSYSKECPVCKQPQKNIMNHLAKKNDERHKLFKDSLYDYLSDVIMDMHNDDKLVREMVECLKKEFKGISNFYPTDVSIGNLIRSVYNDNGVSSRDNVSKRIRGDNALSHNPKTKKKNAGLIKSRSENVEYDERIMTQPIHWIDECATIEKFGQDNYHILVHHLFGDDKCEECADSERKRNIHHIDEDKLNFLPSNLENLCVSCNSPKQSFCMISRDFYIPASHFLPNHPRLCQYLHGHEWKLTVYIRKRITKKSGMVMDFSDLKKIVNHYVVDELDHNYINNFIENPTAENIIFWIWDQLMYNGLKGIHKIDLWESKDACCTINQADMIGYFMESFSDKLLFADNGILKIKEKVE